MSNEKPHFITAGQTFEYYVPEQSKTKEVFKAAHYELTQAILSVALAEAGIPPIATRAVFQKIFPQDKSDGNALYGFLTVQLDDPNSEYVYWKAGIRDQKVVPDRGDKRGKLLGHIDEGNKSITVEYYLPKNTHHGVHITGHAFVVGVRRDVRDQYRNPKD